MFSFTWVSNSLKALSYTLGEWWHCCCNCNYLYLMSTIYGYYVLQFSCSSSITGSKQHHQRAHTTITPKEMTYHIYNRIAMSCNYIFSCFYNTVSYNLLNVCSTSSNVRVCTIPQMYTYLNTYSGYCICNFYSFRLWQKKLFFLLLLLLLCQRALAYCNKNIIHLHSEHE